MPKSSLYCICGASLDTGNMGVSALAASLVKNILYCDQDGTIALLIGNRHNRDQVVRLKKETVSCRVVNYRLSPKSKWNEHIIYVVLLAIFVRLLPHNQMRRRIISHNKILDTIVSSKWIGNIYGGDSFSDIYGIGRMILLSLPLFIAFLLGKRVILFPQTYGPYTSFFSRIIARFVIKKSSLVFSRDKQGIAYVKKLVGGDVNVQFCPDVAFSLDSFIPHTIQGLSIDALKEKRPIIGFNVNGLLYHGGYQRNNMFGLKDSYSDTIHLLLHTLLSQTHATVMLVPHTFAPRGSVESDPAACSALIATVQPEVRTRIILPEGEYDQSQIKGIISVCDFFIGSRMHSCIGALSQQIPTVGIAYSKKFLGVFDSLDVSEYVLDARSASKEEICQQVVSFFQQRETIGAHIGYKVKTALETISQTFKTFV